MGIIYKITSPTGRLYIGQTKNYPKRLGDYKRCARYEYDSILINSIKKHGIDLHVFEIVEECENETLSEREIFWIKELKTYWKEDEKGMNMTTGGEVGSGTWMHDRERRKKQAERFTSNGNPFYGKKHTEENKRKASVRSSEYNKKNGVRIPEWGAEKGRDVVRRPVVCYNSNGEFVNEYKCGRDAAKELKLVHTSISEVCSGKRTHTGGYVFKYKEENTGDRIEVGTLNQKNVKRPVMTLTPEYDVVCEHPSAQEASEFWGVPKTTINRAAMYNWLTPIRTGHVFIYSDLYDEIFKEAS